MEEKKLVVALAGNPNSGKTTIFNAITGARQHVGNYPGVTVEKKEGYTTYKGVRIEVVDLPGTYSLTAYSIEEVIARNFIIDNSPDVVVDIIDASNLERNLYLATQIIELGVPLVLAFNMSDLAKSRGFKIDTEKLSGLLGVPIVETVGHKGEGIDKLLDTIIAVGQEASTSVVARQHRPNYGSEIEPHIRELTEQIERLCTKDRARWFAIKLLENDNETIKRLGKPDGGCPEHLQEILAHANRIREHIEGITGDAAEIVFAERRYGFISGACTEAVTRTAESRHEMSDRIDKVLTNRYLGLPIFAILMYLMFQMTFTLGSPLVDQLDTLKDILAGAISDLWPAHMQESTLKSLVIDGIIEGVGTVLSFVPLIMLLFLAIAFLEDSGYMARAAFVIDRLMHKIGLHGKSFIPMLIGFGCTVPAVMATRTIESRRDRLTTILVLPLMSCSARVPIYTLIIGAFFPTHQGFWFFLMYLIGILIAIIFAKVFRVSLFKGESAPFVMELPPYRLPTARGLLIHMWERTWMFIKKAGTIIFMIVIILWALATWPKLPARQKGIFEQQRSQVRADKRITPKQINERLAEIAAKEHEAELEYSAIGRIGKFIAPVFKPCGFDWKISTAIIPSFAAKEVFVGQMGIIYSVGEEASEESEPLREKLQKNYSPLVGFSIMLFLLVSLPCVATFAVTAREAGLCWAIFQVTYLTILAWILTTIVYQVGSRLI
ncbi:MAG: ferrous iron transport protein B [Planctomycetes bacterium]|nr:ferrous iron transport protein B [Planctomycetota bacterium]